MKWANIFIYTYISIISLPTSLYSLAKMAEAERDCAGREGNISIKIDRCWWYKIRKIKDEPKYRSISGGVIMEKSWLHTVWAGWQQARQHIYPANSLTRHTGNHRNSFGLIPPRALAARSSDSCHQASRQQRVCVMWCLVLHPRASIYVSHVEKESLLDEKKKRTLSFFLSLYTHTDSTPSHLHMSSI